MAEFLGLVGFSVVSSVTPGPNNVLLWASGASFGFRRTTRHILGTAIGIGAMALAVAAGLGLLATAVPALGFAMKLVGTFYLLYLAVQIGRSGSVQKADVARPLGLVQAAAFQVINPKAWIFAMGAVTTFRPTSLPTVAGSLFVAATMMIVIIPTAALWAAAGGALSRTMANERTHRVVTLVLAALVVATVLSVWI